MCNFSGMFLVCASPCQLLRVPSGRLNCTSYCYGRDHLPCGANWFWLLVFTTSFFAHYSNEGEGWNVGRLVNGEICLSALLYHKLEMVQYHIWHQIVNCGKLHTFEVQGSLTAQWLLPLCCEGKKNDAWSHQEQQRWSSLSRVTVINSL